MARVITGDDTEPLVVSTANARILSRLADVTKARAFAGHDFGAAAVVE